MSLTEYNKKRKFSQTPEPKGKLKKSNNLKGRLHEGNRRCPRFVIQKHHASNLHWDFRLEMNGVLVSWAVPKEPPKTKGIKRLAIMTEDHPLDYVNFEGTIPEPGYGAGTVKIWDKGEYELIGKDKKKIEIKLKGKKMKGNYVFIKTNYGSKPEKSWLFFKI